MRFLKVIISFIIMIGILLGFSLESSAIPNLQIYIPGATYDIATETWVINSYDYKLWVIGAHLDVNDVKFAAAVPTGENGSIQVTWLKPSSPDYGAGSSTVILNDPDWVTDDTNRLSYEAYRTSYATSDPNPATYGFGSWDTDTNTGDWPLMGDGTFLPPAGTFPTDFYEYFIGDFGTGEIVQNYIPGDEWGDTADGEIKIFDISVSGYSWVDIVAYDHVIKSNNKAKYVFTPFSHDGASAIPEPATLFLLGTGLIGLGAFGRRKTKNGSKV
jgi:PEP-CTERM motif